ncbi:hypothetical protein [Streptomyces parvulus]|uniref:hypothetical protein n=1 Tax=Streptomyces parvulus TaxID=146923 RepID=UPI0036CBE7A6
MVKDMFRHFGVIHRAGQVQQVAFAEQRQYPLHEVDWNVKLSRDFDSVPRAVEQWEEPGQQLSGGPATQDVASPGALDDERFVHGYQGQSAAQAGEKVIGHR